MIPRGFFHRTLCCGLPAFVMAMAPHVVVAQSQSIDLVQAKRYFDEARKICESDAGKLWDKSLCGPMLFADPDTRSLAANQADSESFFEQSLEIIHEHARRSAAVQSERQQLEMAQTLRSYLDSYLAQAVDARRPGAQAYGHVLGWRALEDGYVAAARAPYTTGAVADA